jgi:hypothetical protein
VAARKSAELERLLDDKYTVHLARRVLRAAGTCAEGAAADREPMEVEGEAAPDALLTLWREAHAVAAEAGMAGDM